MVIMVFYSPSKTQARETWAPENSGNITGSYGRTCGLRLLIHEEKDESVSISASRLPPSLAYPQPLALFPLSPPLEINSRPSLDTLGDVP